MKTKFFKEIDGEKIIIGLGLEYFDPVETNKRTKAKIEATKEFNQLEETRKGIKEKYSQIAIDRKRGVRLIEKMADARNITVQEIKEDDLTPEELTQIKTTENRIIENTGLIKRKMNELKAGIPALKTKEKEIRNDHGQFFSLSDYEEKITDTKALEIAEKLKQAKEEDCWLLDDLTLVKKVKNKVFVSEKNGKYEFSYPRTITDCKNLDFVKFDEIREYLKTATDEQKTAMATALNAERMANLTAEEKEAEKQRALSGATSQAINLKSKLEIEGDNKATEKAREWLKKEQARIEKLYK